MGFRTLPEGAGNTLGWRIEGRLGDAEVAAMHQQLDEAIAASGSVGLLVDLTGLEGVAPAAAWEWLRRRWTTGRARRVTGCRRHAFLTEERRKG
jgi:hypothetical protein